MEKRLNAWNEEIPLSKDLISNAKIQLAQFYKLKPEKIVGNLIDETSSRYIGDKKSYP